MEDNPSGPALEQEIIMYSGDVRHYGGFTPRAGHADALLAYMRDDSRKTAPRLLVTGYLLELGSQAARCFLEDSIFGLDATTCHNALWVLNSRVLAAPEDEWAVDLASKCVDELLVHAREAKRKQAERLLEEAIERDGGALVMVGADGIRFPISSGANTPDSFGDWRRVDEEMARCCLALARAKGYAAVPALLRYLERHPGKGADRALADLRPYDCVAELCRLVRSAPDGGAAVVLGEIGDTAAIPVLLGTLMTDDGELRAGHVEALGKLGSREAVAPIAGALLRISEGKGSFVDGTVLIRALRGIGGPDAAVALRRFLEGPEQYDWLVTDARIALAEIESPDFGAALITMLYAETDERLHLRAIGELRALADRRAVPALLDRARHSPDGAVRGHAIITLGKLGGRQAIAGLVSLFDADFSQASNWRRFEAKRTCRAELVRTLQKCTGQKWGDDPETWRSWLAATALEE
jgi:HEAT repeat protein